MGKLEAVFYVLVYCIRGAVGKRVRGIEVGLRLVSGIDWSDLLLERRVIIGMFCNNSWYIFYVWSSKGVAWCRFEFARV
jgi:hypothetical protein